MRTKRSESFQYPQRLPTPLTSVTHSAAETYSTNDA